MPQVKSLFVFDLKKYVLCMEYGFILFLFFIPIGALISGCAIDALILSDIEGKCIFGVFFIHELFDVKLILFLCENSSASTRDDQLHLWDSQGNSHFSFR